MSTEAGDWYARLRSPTLTEVDALRFRAWIASDPEHRREFEAIDALWEDVGALANCPEVCREKNQRADKRSFRRRTALAGIAATIVVLVAGVLYRIAAEHNVYRTAVGEQRVVPLADGSVVTLNTASKLRVRYSGHTRRIELLAGQANFEVAWDPRRPFVVAAGRGQVRALGTTFDVYKSGDKVIVTLIEGKVAVLPEINSASATSPSVPHSENDMKKAEIVLAPGEQVSYAKRNVSRLARANMARVLAWRVRKLNFADTPLTEAIEEANRYSALQIELRDAELQAARISGVFEAGKNELFVEGLQSYFQLEIQRPAADRIVLTAR